MHKHMSSVLNGEKTHINHWNLEGFMWKSLKMASAFVGVIVGAGFASGQEILKYFTSFGYLGIFGVLISTALFSYLGMNLTVVGSRLKTTSHEETIYKIYGKQLGVVIDIMIVFTLFGVGVVMIAGAGSIVKQQFNIHTFVGSLTLVILIILTMMLNIDKVINIIGSITPFLFVMMIVISIYSLMTMNLSWSELNEIAISQPSTLPNWFISAVNYVSFNITAGAGMSLVIGGAEGSERVAGIGGFLGGVGIGILIMVANLAIFSRINDIALADMPLLKLFDEISPLLGNVMSIILFGMIFNTGVSLFYAFVARFFPMENNKTYVPIIVTTVVGFFASFIGFTELVAYFYPVIGYFGIILILALLYAPYKIRKVS